jgi:hypothetical protein
MLKYIVFSVFIMLFFILNATAQTYDLRFVIVNSNETNFDVQIQLKSSSIFKLAASNITFDYNTSAISNPSLLSAQNYSGINGNSVYGDMTVTQPDAGVASVNIIYTYSTDAHASDVPTTWTEVAIVRFNIVNSSNTPNLVFRTSGLSLTTIYKIEGSTTTLLSPGDLYSNNDPLPVELNSFTASENNNSVELKWSTSTEVNNYGFSVERRVKNSEWGAVGFVQGSGNSSSLKEYSFKDLNLKAGDYQYRLKQIDNDGKYEYSKVIEVTLNNQLKTFQLFQNYPNPFNPATTIKFAVPKSTQVNLSVYNVLGEVVAVLEDKYLEAGNYQKEFDASLLASGIYIYTLKFDGKAITKMMNLIK